MFTSKKQKIRMLFIGVIIFLSIVIVAGDNENEVSTDNLPIYVQDLFAPANPAEIESQIYDVVKVVDGDTIDVRIDGQVERVRLIGINAPESVDPNRPVECFGVEASNLVKSLLNDKRVRLEADNSQLNKDKYNRLLRYVFLEDGTNVNELIIREGYAYEYTYDLPYKYQVNFKTAELAAKNKNLGLWGDICR